MNACQRIAALIVLIAVIIDTSITFAEEPRALGGRTFRDTIAPILIRHCLECHQGREPAGGLDLTSGLSLAKGGESGKVILEDEPAESLLWNKVDSGEMPPDNKLSIKDLVRLKEWVFEGAPWDNKPLDPFAITTDRRAGYDWWSLQPIVDPPVPKLDNAASPIDAFVIARLNQAGLSLSPRADARTLLRRLSVRLHGIHPDPATLQELEADDSRHAFAALADRYLQSPRYGQRWARHWLDLARFGESQGFERDRMRPHAWRYRDWVVDAFNGDMPYDQFARMQIAGDCFAEHGRDGVIATGFLVAGGWDEVGQSQRSAAMKAIVRQDEMEDYVGTVGQSFLGLTTNCARCHDHKFDPIRQSEYYSLCSALDGVRPGDRKIARADGKTEPEELVYAVLPSNPAGPTRLLLRGNTKTPAEIVSAAGLRSIRGPDWNFGLAPDAPEADRRRALANWITRDNPMFARVIVNRIWQHHFGTGLVATPNDFGFTGGQPSHPLLLDFLAARLIESGWSLKTVQRMIVNSATWQQTAANHEEGERIDAENRLLWRGNRMRLDAETLRDSILLIAGDLNNTVGGPSFQDFRTFNFNSQFYEMLDPVGADFSRRTIYRMVVRSGRNRMLDAFDCPDPSATAPRRSVTTTPLQSLSLMNHSFVLRMSDQTAKRVRYEVGDDATDQVNHVAKLAWCRQPTDNERKSLLAFAQQHGIGALCRVLINSNEFLYVD